MTATWNASVWLEEFIAASQAVSGFKELRADVFRSTVDCVLERGYEVDGRWIALDDAGQYDRLHAGTCLYRSTEDLLVDPGKRNRHETRIWADSADCVEMGKQLLDSGFTPVVLNMASRRNPGGGVRGGAGAQEENLFRRTNLLHSLYQFTSYHDQYDVPRHPEYSYPLPREAAGIYSPGATVFRSSEATGYDLLSEPFLLAFVTVPAISRPRTISPQGQLRLAPDLIEPTRTKIRTILRISAHHDHDAIVLSAFGCGAFRNPPDHVAELFAEVFSEPEFRGTFKTLVFAIFDDHNARKPHNPEGNLIPFQRQFGTSEK